MLKNAKVEVKGDKLTKDIIDCKLATQEDWSKEFLNLTLAIKVVNDVQEAIVHINNYNSKHSDAIISQNKSNIQQFQSMVDAAAIYVNASTRFTDGFVFGLGAEMGISTQKTHCRGPIALQALTTTKYLVEGTGQIRE